MEVFANTHSSHGPSKANEDLKLVDCYANMLVSMMLASLWRQNKRERLSL